MFPCQPNFSGTWRKARVSFMLWWCLLCPLDDLDSVFADILTRFEQWFHCGNNEQRILFQVCPMGYHHSPIFGYHCPKVLNVTISTQVRWEREKCTERLNSCPGIVFVSPAPADCSLSNHQEKGHCKAWPQARRSRLPRVPASAAPNAFTIVQLLVHKLYPALRQKPCGCWATLTASSPNLV